jgi:ABC-type multidrug transport system fused ATPase/permease subunit
VYQSFVTNLMTRPTNTSTVSRRSAHSTLARQIVDFLEYDFNHVVEALYNVIGSLVLLYLYNHSVVGICLGVLVPVLLMARGYGQRTVRMNMAHHDELERQVDIIQEGNSAGISDHYERLRGWQVRLSDQEAWNFGVTEFLVLLAIAGSLLVSTQFSSTALPVGSLVGVYTYMLKFAAGLETIPYMVQRIGALQDIIRRMSSSDPLDSAST